MMTKMPKTLLIAFVIAMVAVSAITSEVENVPLPHTLQIILQFLVY